MPQDPTSQRTAQREQAQIDQQLALTRLHDWQGQGQQPGGRGLTGLGEGTAPGVIDARIEDALVLAETALTAAHAAVEQSDVAEKTAVQSTYLAQEALRAAQAAYHLAQQAQQTSAGTTDT